MLGATCSHKSIILSTIKTHPKATEKTNSVSPMKTKSDTTKIKATLKKRRQRRQQNSMTLQRKQDQKDADRIRREIVW